MVGALFGARGDGSVCTTVEEVIPPGCFSGKVKLFKHIHESLKYNRFDTKLSQVNINWY